MFENRYVIILTDMFGIAKAQPGGKWSCFRLHVGELTL